MFHHAFIALFQFTHRLDLIYYHLSLHSRQVEPTATDSSQDELDFDEEEDDDELGIVPKGTAATFGQPLKRKDGSWDTGTASKRLKLKDPDISDAFGSASAPGS